MRATTRDRTIAPTTTIRVRAIAAGVIFGTLGALALSNNYGYGGPRSHTAWCEWRYKTYNPATDQFYAKPGVLAYCHAPYDY